MSDQTSFPAGMSAADCGKLHQLLVETAMNDSAVKESRPPDTIIFKPADLTRAEKVHLMDLLTSFMSMVKQMPDDARMLPSARVAGQPVFYGLELTLNEGGWRWFWMDRRTGLIDPQFVNMGGLTLAEARRRVISNYDRSESKRITKYNLDLVVSVARRRIMKWAKYGSGHEAHIDPVEYLAASKSSSWLATGSHTGRMLPSS
ncbi:hypothetical protein B0J15DRAFT_461111 [Fusarium solani]|uniref:Uncharacterized protein n=1 Tax=Fusarium solani TaxID=169388 RepID=A0A9P9KZ48_FUSSL|nr:uncharacterized protein B0J15DRAFT_461111 [Fusarium solani]KAH7271054.1 hypothetical protein B0J15DRAFT_461111 [Fusarium solani]